MIDCLREELKFFVTGGAGFVGKHIIKSLIEKNHNVTIFDNLSNSSENQIKPLLEKVDFVNGDITKYDQILNNIKGSDFVIHLASMINVQKSFENPDFVKIVNVEGTKNILEACKENQIKNIIVTSSAAVYGDCSDPNEQYLENTKTIPISPYGESKLEMEKLVTSYAKKYNFNLIILRFFNIYGADQTPEYAGVITKFLQKIQENKPLEIFGDGSQTRDFVSIDDVVNAINCSISKIEGKQGKIYNIANGKSISIKELANLMIKLSGKDLDIIYSNSKIGDIKFSQADISLAKKELNYIPKVALKDGIKKLI